MADWDADSPELHPNLTRLLRRIRHDARRREAPTVESARRWQVAFFAKICRCLTGSSSVRFGAKSVSENIQVRIAGRYGVVASDVASELGHFEQVLQRAVHRLDEWLPPDAEPDSDQLAAIVEVCAWAHAEWVRIHPFANGNGRTARLWVKQPRDALRAAAIPAVAASARRQPMPSPAGEPCAVIAVRR